MVNIKLSKMGKIRPTKYKCWHRRVSSTLLLFHNFLLLMSPCQTGRGKEGNILIVGSTRCSRVRKV
jgi:hypothetical protein